MNTSLPSSTAKTPEPRRERPWLWMISAALLLAAAALLSLSRGSTDASSLAGLWDILGQRGDSAAARIFLYVRIPRTLAAMLSGAALSAAGVILQTVLNNALAGPNIIGVNAGAGLFATAAAVFFPGAAGLVPAASFLGALLAAGSIYALAWRTGSSRMTIVLAGVAVSSFLSAGVDCLTTLFPDEALGASTFMAGGFSNVTLASLRLPGWYIAAGLAAALLLSRDMNVLALGDDVAASLGLRVSRCRLLLLAAASLLAGSAVSFAGLLGFVGLIVPHFCRFLVGTDCRRLLPLSGLLGAAFVTLCDLLARTLFSPYELPVGIIMSFLGGPFFLWLLLHRKGTRLS